MTDRPKLPSESPSRVAGKPFQSYAQIGEKPYLPKPSKVVLWLTAIWLAVTWTTVLLVDFLNIGNVQEKMISHVNPLPLAWYVIFKEAGPTENLQWIVLALSLLVSLTILRHAKKHHLKRLLLPSLSLSVGLTLMLIEDAVNLRHVVSDFYFPLLFNEAKIPQQTRMLWELTFYSMLATLMAFSALAYWLNRIPNRKTSTLLISAYVVYGAVGFASAMRRVGNWQEKLGEYLIATLKLESLPAWEEGLRRIDVWRETIPDYTFTMGFLITDKLLEESVELIAASLLLAALFSLKRDLVSKHNPTDFYKTP